MSQSVITNAFEQLKAQQAANGSIIVLDEFVFANIPNLDPSLPISRDESWPTDAQIVHRQAVGKTGMVNANAVAYSAVMGADVGDFEFNWIGLISTSSNTVCMIVHAPVQKKIKTTAGQQGNVLTRSFLMEYNGASEQTQIITPVDTWQIDFTARLNGVDERIRLENIDIYGEASFLDDGFKVARSGDGYVINRGTGYVSGIKATLLATQAVAVSALPVKIWVDVCWKGTLTSAWASASKIVVASSLADYVENDEQHYVHAVAEILADGSVNDLRTVSLAGQLSQVSVEADSFPYFDSGKKLGVSAITALGRDLLKKGQASDAQKLLGLHDADGVAKYPDLQLSRWRDVGDPRGWGAKGDGATNDTAAFTAIAAAYSGRRIDLNGKTYAVTQLPGSQNRFHNGYFKLGNVTVPAQGEFSLFAKTSATPVNVRRDMRSPKMIGNLTRASGRGAGNVVQSVCLDDVNGYWYSISAHEELGSFVNRFVANTYIGRTAIDKTDYMPDLLGHQGLGMEYRGNDGADRLWTSLSYEPVSSPLVPDATGRYAVSFVYKPVGEGKIADYEIWTVYDSSVGKGSTTPTISADGKYLITRIQETVNGKEQRRIRVFDMQTVRKNRAAKTYDISTQYLSEFVYYPADYGLVTTNNQDIACDGHHVYMLEGGADMAAPSANILVFDVSGHFIDCVSVANVGFEYATSLNTDGTGIYEIEGLHLVRNAFGGFNIAIQYAMGISGARKCVIYELGARMPVRLINDDAQGKMPYSMLMGNSTGRDINALSSRGWKVGVVKADGVEHGNMLGLGYDGAFLVGNNLDTQNVYNVQSSGIGGAQQVGVNDSGKGAAKNHIRSDNTGTGVRYQFVKSRSTVHRGSAALQDGDSIVYMDAIGDDGQTDWTNTGGVVGGRIHFRIDGTPTANYMPTTIVFSTNDGTSNSTPVNRWRITPDGHLIPAATGKYNLGREDSLVDNVYAKNGAIQTSDENYKSPAELLSEKEKLVADVCLGLIRKFKYLEDIESKEGLARYHFGAIAQRVQDAFNSQGLDAFDYGVLCYDEWDARPAVYERIDPVTDERGEILQEELHVLVTPAREAGSRFALRYDELYGFMISALVERLAVQSVQMADMGQRLSALEAKG